MVHVQAAAHRAEPCARSCALIWPLWPLKAAKVSDSPPLSLRGRFQALLRAQGCQKPQSKPKVHFSNLWLDAQLSSRQMVLRRHNRQSLEL